MLWAGGESQVVTEQKKWRDYLAQVVHPVSQSHNDPLLGGKEEVEVYTK